MSEYICTSLVVPLRTGPSHRTEMGSQILLGESYTIEDRAGTWTKIRLNYDKYSGWVDNDHFLFTENSQNDQVEIIASDITATLPDNSMVKIFTGSEIITDQSDRELFKAGEIIFRSKDKIITKPNGSDLSTTARQFMNTPYLWGGRTSGGIDCSGLSQIVYKLHGIAIPRDSFNQAETGKTVNLLAEAIPGDLIFFDNNSGKITHVAILYDNNRVIHASGIVRIDTIDHQGIFRSDLNRYTHKLRVIKRLID
ncbi:MAG: C40 family peptidase [Bacteroidales bacterium]|nr:C40 family peptidase [Bacteroidales bacterium]